MKNELTSKKVASQASKVMRGADKRLTACHMMISALQAQIDFIKLAKSVAASALTQAEDKKRK